MNPFVERHQDDISGTLSCFDRVVITGTLPEICHAEAMGGYLGCRDIRLFDYTRWAEPLRNELRENTERLATEAGLQIEFIRNHKAFRKEARIKEILALVTLLREIALLGDEAAVRGGGLTRRSCRSSLCSSLGFPAASAAA